MTPDEARRFHAQLQTLRAQMLAEGDFVVKVERNEVMASATDEDEAPYMEMGQAIASARNKERAVPLAGIDDAMRRLGEDAESFGVCEGCGEDIPPRRLELLPYTRLCVACQGASDTGKARPGRRKVTDYR